MIRFLAVPALFVLALAAQHSTAPAPAIPADAAAMTNPVHATPELLTRAKAMYGVDCAMCHGTAGDGKGDVVADMKLSMKDWTAAPSPLDGMKDGEIFYVIKNGNAKMPPEGGRVKDQELWAMVVYVRSLGKK